MMWKKYVLSVMLLVILFLIWYIYRGGFEVSESTELKLDMENLTSEAETEPSSFKVYITGEIKAPGVYTAYKGERIEDIVKRAGGANECADLTGLNLAEYVKDEQHIKIYKIDSEANKSNNSIQNSEDALININTASKEELMSLPQIGEVTANEIISYRNINGSFKSIEEIKNVSGIGDKTFEKIKSLIKI